MTTGARSKQEVTTIVDGARAAILGLGVQRLALFGSVERGTANAESDVDFLVEFQPEKKTFDRFVALADLLEGLLGCDVELVTPESLSPYLKSHILSEARDVIRAA